MMTVLSAGTKMPRPKPASASCGTTVRTVTGTKTEAHMTAQVSAAPAKPRWLSVEGPFPLDEAADKARELTSA